MTTKEEYIDALDSMEVSYYNFDNCMSAMNKFKEDVNLLYGLVNEHFEEKVETNFDHYKDGILDFCIDNLAVVKGRPTLCYKTNCNDCDFKINQIGCRQKAKDWLKQPHEKLVYKLTKFEYDLLQIKATEAITFKNMVFLMEMKEKGYFKGIDDNELIGDILAKCEVIEDRKEVKETLT